jgi:hypothetical protein
LGIEGIDIDAAAPVFESGFQTFYQPFPMPLDKPHPVLNHLEAFWGMLMNARIALFGKQFSDF